MYGLAESDAAAISQYGTQHASKIMQGHPEACFCSFLIFQTHVISSMWTDRESYRTAALCPAEGVA